MAQQEAQQSKKNLASSTIAPATTATVSLAPPTTAQQPHIVTLYKVNSEAFESCDIGGGQRVGQVKIQDPQSHTGSLVLPPSLLSIDDNFFLGKILKEVEELLCFLGHCLDESDYSWFFSLLRE